MNKTDKKVICIILLCIVILSSVLIFKIVTDRKYDEKMYNDIYQEYDELFSKNENEVIKEENKKTEIKDIEDDNSEFKDKNKALYRRNSDSKVIASIIIPKLEITYPVINEMTEEYLKIAPCKLWGGNPNEKGNFSIIGHNYKNEEFFSKLYTLQKGDKVILEDRNHNSITYSVYNTFEVDNDDFSCLENEDNDKIDLTLITCTDKKTKRLVVKCEGKG